ncbi:SPRY domain-containing SOCS box protein 2 [Megalops cyprinoides]|uniref:SPRY domain-containing SOCS box protein 2 n=1 Tax=Megalops cyprinoides TaxID=118141 RepID=UPI001864AB32|nr:SPRY domain-containing SOCS box protein 2 [Megalops cyprinoides]
MGLTLCRWLSRDCPRRNSTPSGWSSSPFMPFAVTPPSRLAVLLDASPAPPTDPRSSWSPAHHSPNFTLSRDGTVAERAPAEQSTDGARGAEGERAGLHVWEVRWDPAERGSHAVVGVSTHRCPRQASGYTVLVGGDSESWGWELGSNQLWHSAASHGQYPRKGAWKDGAGPEERPPLAVPARVLMVLDGDAGTLGFVVDGCFLGVAVQDLPQGACLFPAVSSVWGGCRITLRYLNGAPREPPSLTSLCRLSVRQSMGKDRETQTDRLPLPPGLRRLLWDAVC